MRFRQFIAAVLAGAALVGFAPSAFAAGEAEHPPELKWSFEGPFGKHDRAALQRGFQVYKEVCSTCHSMNHLRYRNLGEPNGPFAAVAPRNWAKEGTTPVIGVPGHGKEWVDANENPYVRAIAEQYTVTELDRTTAQDIERKARPSDRFVSPYTNPFQAAALHGVAPPDLSVITKARANGPNYVHGLLVGYKEPPAGKEPPGGASNLHYNPYFPGGWIAMPPPLSEDQVTSEDGTKATVEQMSQDLVTFLDWAADPQAESRKTLGMQVLIYLLILSALLYWSYRLVWRDQKH